VKESNQYIKDHGKIPEGKAGVTGPGNLACSHVIHAVGPRWSSKDIFHPKSDNPPILLHNCVFSSLETADSLNIKSITIPSISTGIFGGNISYCSKIIVVAIIQYFHFNPESQIQSVQLIS